MDFIFALTSYLDKFKSEHVLGGIFYALYSLAPILLVLVLSDALVRLKKCDSNRYSISNA